MILERQQKMLQEMSERRRQEEEEEEEKRRKEDKMREKLRKAAMEAAERAVVLRLGKVIWDSPVSALSHDKLGELFMTGNHRQETSTR